MTQISETIVTEAIFSDGVLKPVTPLALSNDQRVKVIVQAISKPAPSERAEALQQLFEDMDKMDFYLEGSLPSREELHDRSV